MTACRGAGNAWRNLGEGFLAALQFLTVVSVRRAVTPQGIAFSLVYFPIVGLGIGGLLYGLYRLFDLFLPLALTSALVIAALVLVSGANHLDGFIDTCDGMAAGRTPEQRLAIMRDTHAGSFGVVGVCCLFLVKYVALLFLPAQFHMAALLLMPVMGRWAMVYALSMYPSARSEGMGHAYRRQARWWALAVATLISVAIAFGLMRVRGLALVAAVWIAVLLLSTLLSRKLGGLTGDTYGATNEVTEALALVLVPLVAGGYF